MAKAIQVAKAETRCPTSEIGNQSFRRLKERKIPANEDMKTVHQLEGERNAHSDQVVDTHYNQLGKECKIKICHPKLSSSDKMLGSYNAKLISSILISQMIDENKSEENRLLFPMISQSSSYHIKQSTANHISDSINRAFTPLPGKLEHRTSLDKTIHIPDGEQCPYMKQGFTSITITARKTVSSSNHALKEIASDPASSMCRSNDLVMKLPISPVEHGQRCRHADNQEYYAHSYTRCGICNSRQFPNASYPDLISNTENNLDHLSNLYKNRNGALYVSCVHVKPQQCFYTIIYHVGKTLSLPVAQLHVGNERVYKAELSFKIHGNISQEDNTDCKGIREIPRQVTTQNDDPLFGDLTNELKQNQNELVMEEFLQTECPVSSDCLPEKLPMSNTCTEVQHLKCDNNQVEDPNGEHEPNNLISNNQNIEDGDLQKALKVDICLQRDCQPQGFSNLVPERSSFTRFNYIFGRQTSKGGKGKQKMQKENVPPNGCKWVTSHEKNGICYIGNMQMPTVFNQDNMYIQQGDISKHLAMMTLREALELYRPDFISNSQGRVQKLELMSQLRKTQQNQDLQNHQRLPLHRLPTKISSSKRKVFTVPDPQSDNLFKPKERAISEKEMLQRSKRIYMNLPEVKKKKEEEDKRMVTLSNRQRAELFKKKLLDQVLQRNFE
ncbi:(E2-independent) E3 ubiquitin-conjugating enzyme FATS [Discoglossus pictus]